MFLPELMLVLELMMCDCSTLVDQGVGFTNYLEGVLTNTCVNK